MQSFKEYSNSKFTYYNSIQSSIENKISESYEELISKHGASIDSILYKMNLYNKRIRNNNYINENSQNVLFNIDEQFAVRDILVTIANQYIESLCNEFCQENDIMIEESAKDFLNKIGQAAKAGSDKVTQGFKSLGEKVSKLKEFIKDIMNKAIKSAKELVEKITDLMLSIGGTLSQLVEKLGGNEEESYDIFKELVANTVKDEKVSEENVYESIADKLNNGELITEKYITEFLGFGKKKDKDAAEKGNEYDKAAQAKEGGKSNGKLKPLAEAGLKILLQMMAYYAVTVVLPAVITLIAGPLAGAIVEVITRVTWSGATIFKQVKDMKKVYKSPEYQQMPKWAKAVRWAMFFVSLGFALYAGGKAISDGIEIGKKIVEGAINEVLPSEAVQKVTEILNNWYKSLTGGDAAGYEKMVESQNATMTKILEITGEGKEASDAAKAKFEENARNEFKVSETNNFQHTRDLGQDKLAEVNEKIVKMDIKSSKAMTDAISEITVETPGTTAFAIDGATLGKIGRAEYITQIAKAMNVDPSDIDISQISNIGLREATNKAAGTVFQVIVKGDATQEFADTVNNAVQQVAKNAGMGHGFFHMWSKVADNLDPVTKIIEQPVDLFKNSWSAFAGLLPIATKFTKTGGFKLRLGSGRTGNHIYDIEPDGIKEMPFNEVNSQYGSKNPTVFKNMAKIVNDNNKELIACKKKLEEQKKLSRDEKKKLKAITAQLEKMKEGSSEYKLLVFFTKDEFANKEVTGKKKDTSKNEAKEDNLYPVCFLNPLILAGGDLAPRSSSKKPRANIYFAKGLFSRWELLPMDGGMSKEDIINMFTSLMKESLKACYDMCIDLPFIKDGKKYVENKDSLKKGERFDFGGFTNAELTEIFNNPDEVTKYLSGKYASDVISGGKHEFSEKTDQEYLKKHHDKVVKEYEDIIKNDDEVKKLIDDSPTLKKKLYDKDGNFKSEELDKISDNIIRVETNYLGSKKKKKGFFAKLKDWWNGNSDDKKEEQVDPKELEQFALKLASKRIKLKKQKVEEGLEEFEDFTILEANMEIFEREFVNYFNNEELLNESSEEEQEMLLY